jgi:hypothetical protein
MSRLIAAATLLVVAFACVNAQGANAAKKIEPSLGENREWVWKLPADGEVALLDMLKLYADTRDLVLIYDARRIAGSVSFHSSEETTLSGQQIDLFVANCLSEYRYVLVEADAKQLKVLPGADAATFAPVIDRTELETTAAWKWVTVRYRPANLEVNALRGALQNLTTRQGGMVTPSAASGDLLICERADRARELVKLANDMDAAMATDIRPHTIPETVDADDAVRALQELLGAADKYRMARPTFTRSPGQQKVLVRGPADLHADVEVALAAMK